MNETMKNGALALVVIVTVYLAVAFVRWDLDASQWLPKHRAVLIGLCATCAAGAVGIRNVKRLS